MIRREKKQVANESSRSDNGGGICICNGRPWRICVSKSDRGKKRGRRKKVEAGDHEGRYMIQNTLRYVGKHGALVYILDLLDLEASITAEMKKAFRRTTRCAQQEDRRVRRSTRVSARALTPCSPILRKDGRRGPTQAVHIWLKLHPRGNVRKRLHLRRRLSWGCRAARCSSSEGSAIQPL